jgi:uncharacterized protein (DUF4415 family)
MKTDSDDGGRELAALAELPDQAIDTFDQPETDDWSAAERRRSYGPLKRSITIRLDADVIDWFRRREPKYHTVINHLLRQHMLRTTGGSHKES